MGNCELIALDRLFFYWALICLMGPLGPPSSSIPNLDFVGSSTPELLRTIFIVR